MGSANSKSRPATPVTIMPNIAANVSEVIGARSLVLGLGGAGAPGPHPPPVPPAPPQAARRWSA